MRGDLDGCRSARALPPVPAPASCPPSPHATGRAPSRPGSPASLGRSPASRTGGAAPPGAAWRSGPHARASVARSRPRREAAARPRPTARPARRTRPETPPRRDRRPGACAGCGCWLRRIPGSGREARSPAAAINTGTIRGALIGTSVFMVASPCSNQHDSQPLEAHDLAVSASFHPPERYRPHHRSQTDARHCL